MDPYQKIVNMFVFVFSHGPNPDQDELRQRVRNCLTFDDEDTRDMWNKMMQENQVSIYFEISTIAQSLQDGLQLNSLLRRRLWDFVYKNTMMTTRYNDQEFHQEHFDPQYISDNIDLSIRVQEIVEHIEDEEPIPGLGQFLQSWANHYDAKPRGNRMFDHTAWYAYLGVLDDLTREFRNIHLHAERIMQRPGPHNIRFAFIVATIIDSTKQMIVDYINHMMQHARYTMQNPTPPQPQPQAYEDLDEWD